MTRSALSSVLFVAAAAAPAVASPTPTPTVTSIATRPGADGALEIVAHVHGLAANPVLVDDLGHHEAARSVQRLTVGDEPIAIAFVIQGGELWMGNDQIVPEDDPSRTVGALPYLEVALDGLDLAHTTPAGSEVALITYSDSAHTVSRLQPTARFGAAVLGSQKDYFGRKGTELVEGVESALTELAHAHAARRLLVVIGDGNDTNNDAAKGALANLRKRAEQLHVDTRAVIYKAAFSDPADVVSRLDPQAVTVHSFDGMAAAGRTILESAEDDQTLVFGTASLPHDGRAHALTIAFDGAQTEPQPVLLPAPADEPGHGLAWWPQIALGVLLVGGLAVGARWRAR